MNILDNLLGPAGSSIVGQLAAQFGLNQQQVQTAAKVLLPILAGAVAQNIRGGGLDSLLGALAGGQHERYVDRADSLAQPATTKDGNDILGHLLGDKSVSREAASRASSQSGISADVLRKLLPVLATVLMGVLAKGARRDGMVAAPDAPSRPQPQPASASTGAPTSPLDGLMGMLNPILDQNRDGSSVDDLLRMAGRFLNR